MSIDVAVNSSDDLKPIEELGSIEEPLGCVEDVRSRVEASSGAENTDVA